MSSFFGTSLTLRETNRNGDIQRKGSASITHGPPSVTKYYTLTDEQIQKLMGVPASSYSLKKRIKNITLSDKPHRRRRTHKRRHRRHHRHSHKRSRSRSHRHHRHSHKRSRSHRHHNTRRGRRRSRTHKHRK